MTHPKEPPRLLDAGSGAPDPLRDVLRAGRGELPDTAQLARLRARLPLGPPPPGSPSPGAPPAGSRGAVEAAGAAGAAGGSLIPSALVGAALAVAVVVGWEWRDRAAEHRPAPAVPPTAEIARLPPSPVPSSRPSTPVPPVSEAIPSPSTRATAAEITPSATPVLAAPPAAASAAAPIPSGSPDAPPFGASGSVPPGEGESEVRLLQRAQEALASDPARALSLAGEHAQRFPRGGLGEERETLAVAALVRMGRAAEARDRASRLLRAFPGTAYRARLEGLVGIESLQKNETAAPHTP